MNTRSVSLRGAASRRCAAVAVLACGVVLLFGAGCASSWGGEDEAFAEEDIVVQVPTQEEADAAAAAQINAQNADDEFLKLQEELDSEAER